MATRSKKYSFGSLFQFTPVAVDEVRQNFRTQFQGRKGSGNPPLISYDQHSYTFSFESSEEESQVRDLFAKLLKGYIDRKKSESDLLENQRLIPLPGTAVDDPCAWDDLFPLEEDGNLLPLDEEDDGFTNSAKGPAGYRPEIWKPSTVSVSSISTELIDALRQQTGCLLDPNPQNNELHIHGGNVPQALTVLRELEPLMTLAHNPANSHGMSLGILTEESRFEFARLNEASLHRIILDPDLNSVDASIFRYNRGIELYKQWQGHRYPSLGRVADAAHKGAGEEVEKSGEQLDPLPASHFLSTNDSKFIERWAGNVVDGTKAAKEDDDSRTTDDAEQVLGRPRLVRHDSDDSDDSTKTERAPSKVVAPKKVNVPEQPAARPESPVISFSKPASAVIPSSEPAPAVRAVTKPGSPIIPYPDASTAEDAAWDSDHAAEAPAISAKTRKVREDSDSDNTDRESKSSKPLPMPDPKPQYSKAPSSAAPSYQQDFEPYKDNFSSIASETSNNWATPHTPLLAKPPQEPVTQKRHSRWAKKNDHSDDESVSGRRPAASVVSSNASFFSQRSGRSRGRGRGRGYGYGLSGRTRVVREDSSDSDNDPRPRKANGANTSTVWGDTTPQPDGVWGDSTPAVVGPCGDSTPDPAPVAQPVPAIRSDGNRSSYKTKTNGYPPKSKTMKGSPDNYGSWGTPTASAAQVSAPVIDEDEWGTAGQTTSWGEAAQSGPVVDNTGWEAAPPLKREETKEERRARRAARKARKAEEAKNAQALASNGNDTAFGHANQFETLDNDQSGEVSVPNGVSQPEHTKVSGQEAANGDAHHDDSDKVSDLIRITPASSQVHHAGAPPPGYEMFGISRVLQNRQGGQTLSGATDSEGQYLSNRKANLDVGILTKQELLKIKKMREMHELNELKHGKPPRVAPTETVQWEDEASTRVFHQTMNQQARKKPARKVIDAAKAEAMREAWGATKLQVAGGAKSESSKTVNTAISMKSGKTETTDMPGMSMAKRRIEFSRKDVINERMTIDLKRRLTNRVVADLLPVFQTAIPFPGDLRFEIRFGQFLASEPSGEYQSKTVEIEAWQRLYEKNRGLLSSANVFTNILTRNGADADHFLDIKIPRAKTSLFEGTTDERRKIRFEFHCRGKKNDEFMIVMGPDGSHHIERPFQRLGCVNIHCTDQIWDAAAVVSASWRLPEAPEVIQAVEALVQSVYIPSGKTELELSYRVPQMQEFAVKRVVMRRSTRHKCLAENKTEIELQLTEVQRLFVELRQNGVYLAYASKYEGMVKRSMIHYEASLHSSIIEAAFAENHSLKLGEKATSWTAESLVDKPRIHALLEVMQLVVAKIDGVGYHNVGSALFLVNEQREREGGVGAGGITAGGGGEGVRVTATADSRSQLAVPEAPINVPGVRGGPAQHVIGNYALGFGGARVPRPELKEQEGVVPGDSASQAPKEVSEVEVADDRVGFW